MSSERLPGPRGLDSSAPAVLIDGVELGGNPRLDTVETLGRIDVPGLAVLRQRRGTAVIVSAAGEVDMTNSPALSQELEAATDSAIDVLVVDLNAVTFFGSSGLAALMACRQGCSGRDIAFRIAAKQRAVLRPIQLTGLDQELTLYPTVEQALAG